jgi:hypothetical protein
MHSTQESLPFLHDYGDDQNSDDTGSDMECTSITIVCMLSGISHMGPALLSPLKAPTKQLFHWTNTQYHIMMSISTLCNMVLLPWIGLYLSATNNIERQSDSRYLSINDYQKWIKRSMLCLATMSISSFGLCIVFSKFEILAGHSSAFSATATLLRAALNFSAVLLSLLQTDNILNTDNTLWVSIQLSSGKVGASLAFTGSIILYDYGGLALPTFIFGLLVLGLCLIIFLMPQMNRYNTTILAARNLQNTQQPIFDVWLRYIPIEIWLNYSILFCMSCIWLPFIESQTELFDDTFHGIFPFWRMGVNHFSVTLLMYIIIGHCTNLYRTSRDKAFQLSKWIVVGIFCVAFSILALFPSRGSLIPMSFYRPKRWMVHILLYICSISSMLFMSIGAVLIPLGLIQIIGLYTTHSRETQAKRCRALILALYRCITYSAGTISHPIYGYIQDTYGSIAPSIVGLCLCITGMIFSGILILREKKRAQGQGLSVPSHKKAHKIGLISLALLLLLSILTSVIFIVRLLISWKLAP